MKVGLWEFESWRGYYFPMNNIKITSASRKDRPELIKWFEFYSRRSAILKRIDCYTSHNFTVIAKDKNKIVRVLQWYAKEEPRHGLAEFEEVFVLDKYRGKGIGFRIVEFAIKSVKDHFKKLNFKARKIFLFVGKKNLAARKLYEKYGFKSAAKAGNLFNDNTDELLYTLDLT